MTSVLAIAWAALLATPLVVVARRATPAARALSLGATPTAPASEPTRWRTRVARDLAGARDLAVVRVVLAPFVRRRAARIEEAISRELPVAIDLLGVAVGAGCTPYLAVEAAARWAPPTVAGSLDAVVRAGALGVGFVDAWRDAAARHPQLASLADALSVGDRSGAPVGPALARLAAEERATARRRVESQARRVPVRLLVPLVFLVLPAFVLLTVVPGLAAGLARL